MSTDGTTGRVRHGRGFTLVELLVVIAIISILAGMLLPALRGAMQQAEFISCLNNQRQLYLSLTMYANTYNQWPTNERVTGTPYDLWYYYRYATRGASGTRFLEQMDGIDAYKNAAYRCTGRLPGGGGLTGAVPRNGQNWTWACRADESGSEAWKRTTPNGDRGWYAYQGPLRAYATSSGAACGAGDVTNNAWDLWGGAWRWNSSLSSAAPIRNTQGNSHVPLRNSIPRVIAYCPNMVKTDGPSTWWHGWSAPHGNQPTWNIHTTNPPVDARNYLFTDGHALSLQRY